MEDIFLVEKFLTNELSLSKKEITLYFCLIKYGAMTVLGLSELSSINRATTHVNIDSLTKKGLVTQIKKGRGSRRIIIAEPFEKLSLIFKERRAKLETAENQLSSVIKKLSGLKKENKANNNAIAVRYYEGKNEVRLLYDEVLKANEIRTYANTSEIFEFFPSNASKFIDAHRKNRKMLIWEIMENSKETQAYIKQMDPKRFFYRVTEKLAYPSIDYLIFDNKVAIVDAPKGKNLISGILIENSNFYNISKAIHEFIWSHL